MSGSILSQAPPVVPIKDIHLPEIIESSGSHGIPIFEIRKPDSGIVKLEIVFLGGRPQEQKKLASSTCAALLREGAGPWSSKQMADYVGYYGASLEVHATLDTINIDLVCLKKYLGKFLRPLEYILNQPLFQAKELSAFIKRRNQKLKVELNKNEVVSYRQLTEAIFGSEHPYGYNSTATLYRNLVREDLNDHFDQNIHADRCFIFAAGDLTDNEYQIIQDISSLIRPGTGNATSEQFELESSQERKLLFPGSINQSSIKLGRRLFTRKHPDFIAMSFLNTLLGGFFGSRLVATLREKEGLTYGIYSSLDAMLNDGILMISTEVASENVNKSLRLIYEEFEKLQNDLVHTEELDHVRNYMMGIILHLFDGPFNSIRAIKSLALSRIPTSEIKSLIHISQTINPQEIISLAQKYLNRNDFWEVVVGSHSHNT